MKNRKNSSTTEAPPSPYADADAFLADLRAQYPQLSRQLQAIARHVEHSGAHIALQGIQQVAQDVGVQPSAVVRFAKHFGFHGYTQLQTLFRAGAARQLAPQRDYQDRIRSLIGTAEHAQPLAGTRIAHEVVEGGIASLQALQATLADAQSAAAFEAAVQLLVDAPAIWLAAARRAFPVGAYLAYALQHTAKPVHWLHGLGAMQMGELRAMAPGDVMVAVSFEPYANETLGLADAALARGARLLALTDSPLSPLATHASATLLAQDSATFGFRSLTGTLCLAQSLFIALAYRMELVSESPQKP
ncbi:MAG: MurR/RpiR family transcriptional regulator [Comamonas sp.]